MHKRTLFTAMAIFPTIVLLHADAAPRLGDEAITGRIHSGSDGLVRVCFDHDVAPSVGHEYDVIRHEIRALPKGPVTLESTQTGILRIVSIDADHCANAALINGTAHALDWVAARTSA